MDSPVVSFPVLRSTRLRKTLVEREVVSHTVSPPLSLVLKRNRSCDGASFLDLCGSSFARFVWE